MQVPWIGGRSIRISRTLVTLSVVVGVLVTSAYFGPRASSRLVKSVSTGLGVLALVSIALRNMPAALTVLILTASSINYEIGTGTQSSINVAMLLTALLTGIWAARMLVHDRALQLPAPAIVKPLIGFLAVALLSWLASYALWDTQVPRPSNAFFVQAGQYSIFALSVAAFLLTAAHSQSEKMLQRWVIIIVAVGTIAIVYQIMTGSSILRQGITGAMLMWPFVLLFGQLLYNRTLGAAQYVVGVLVIAAWVYWVITSGVITWKGGWVPAGLAMGFLMLARFRKARLPAILVMALVLLIWRSQLLQVVLQTEQGGSALYRPAIWYDVIRLSTRTLLLGLGPANYIYYWRTPDFRSVSYETARVDHPYAWTMSSYAPPSHNMFVDILAQTGIAGLFFFGWAIIAILVIGWRARQQVRTGFLRGYSSAVLAGFVALLLSSFVFADWLIPFVYNIGLVGFRQSVYTWLLLGTLVPLAARPVEGEGQS